jgi:hypothetical protein
MLGRLVSGELEGMWREVVVSCFTIGGTKEATESVSQDTRCLGRDSSRSPPRLQVRSVITASANPLGAVVSVLSGEAAGNTC